MASLEKDLLDITVDKQLIKAAKELTAASLLSQLDDEVNGASIRSFIEAGERDQKEFKSMGETRNVNSYLAEIRKDGKHAEGFHIHYNVLAKTLNFLCVVKSYEIAGDCVEVDLEDTGNPYGKF